MLIAGKNNDRFFILPTPTTFITITAAKNKYFGLCAPRHGAAIGPRGAGFVWGFGIAHTIRTATTSKVVSIDSEWQQYSAQVVSDLFFLYGKCTKLNSGATAVYALSCLYGIDNVQYFDGRSIRQAPDVRSQK